MPNIKEWASSLPELEMHNTLQPDLRDIIEIEHPISHCSHAEQDYRCGKKEDSS
jgi:hypothetical protein